MNKSDSLNSNKIYYFDEPKSLSRLYENWFLDYASYVILERAIPKIDDGLKPVQRRILHSLKQLDDILQKDLLKIILKKCKENMTKLRFNYKYNFV